MFQEMEDRPSNALPAVPSSAPDGAAAADTAWRVLAVLSALMGFASISTDFYLPAMPAMAAALHAGHGMLEFSITGYLIGFSVGQLFWGPVSDKFGRRLPVAAGLVLFIIGSVGCALAGSAETIIGWRIVQALGASACVVISRAIVRDLYEGARAARMLSTLMVVMAIAPLLGPIIGAQVAAWAGWRAIFWLLVALGLASLVALYTIPETLSPLRRHGGRLSGAFARYAKLLTERRILAYAGAGGFFYAGMFSYIAGTPFAYITYHHLPAQYYGLLFGAGILGIMATNVLNARLVTRLGADRLLVAGALIAALAGIACAVATWTDWGGLWGLLLPLFVFISCTGLIVANSVAGALAEFSMQAGSVSALVGALQYGSGIAGSGLVGFFADGTPRPMGWVIALAGIGSVLCARSLVQPPRKGAQIEQAI
ncbi:multidrug effflux MFS transporter [Burkholderia multivorans]|uniref:multidrug effflux MFS transporter n=1 Tax=Burkholderia multivorans TaxID=87883 RepID=UPI001C2427D0|nr:multidrug effflux MFS transporter [Burkholderia multivorans]MBU9618689.1 multidrug effflux MFS transporter [Burkholderia multivorans]